MVIFLILLAVGLAVGSFCFGIASYTGSPPYTKKVTVVTAVLSVLTIILALILH